MSTTTYDLDAAVAAVAQAKRERKAAEVQEREEMERKKAEARVVYLRQVVTDGNIFTAEFTAATHMRFTSDTQYGRIELDYLGEWHLPFDGVSRFGIYYPNGSRAHTGVMSDGLEQKLLAAFADWHEELDAAQEHRQRLARQQVESERQEAEEKAARKADNDACEQEIAAAKAAAEAEMWHWPEGVSITLYHTRWQDGRDSDGAPSYDEGWSQYDGPDSFGYITLLPNGKRIRLIAEAHLPVVEEVTISEAKQLPSSLRHAKAITLEGIRYYYGGYGVEPYYRHEEGERVTVQVGYEPVEAVRNIVEDVNINSGIPF